MAVGWIGDRATGLTASVCVCVSVAVSHSGGVDQCVKMWSVGGRPFGKLLQAVPSAVKNREWNLASFDADKAMRKEDEAIHNVEEMVRAGCLIQRSGPGSIVTLCRASLRAYDTEG